MITGGIPLDEWSGAGATKETGEKIVNTINRLNKSTTILNCIMIGLTIILVWLTLVLVKFTAIMIQR